MSDYEELPRSQWEPMTEGLVALVRGDKPRIEYDLKKCDPSGVAFVHERPQKLPDDELLQLAQLNINPPTQLLAEIARRGLQKRFRALWDAGEHGTAEN